MSGPLSPVPPKAPISIEEALALYPSVRQSLLAKFDDCPLSALFDLKYSRGWSTHPQARGTLFHRFAAECLRTMHRQGHETIPVAEALEILLEVVRQADVPPEERVRAPLRDMKDLRMAAIKFASDNSFSVSRIVAIEQRLSATLSYADPVTGEARERVLSGQLDALLFRPPDGAVVIDWKDTWGLPPEPKERNVNEGAADELKGISYHGYFQQRFYGWLVMRNYSNVQRVTLREFYVRKTKARKATIDRTQLEEVERDLAVLVEAFDRAVASGQPEWPYRAERMGEWVPQPGRHCGFCVGKRQCPIKAEARGDGAIASDEHARQYAAELQVVDELREHLREALKTWVETSGRPVPVKWSKGRRLIGWFQTRRGRRFGAYTPDESDRGTHAVDAQLEEAMRQSAAEARRARRAA